MKTQPTLPVLVHTSVLQLGDDSRNNFAATIVNLTLWEERVLRRDVRNDLRL